MSHTRYAIAIAAVLSLGCSGSDSDSASSAQDRSASGGAGGGGSVATTGSAGADGTAGSGGGSGTEDDVPFATKRAACTFKQGALPSETFGPSIASLDIPIDTILIVSQENHSFDNYFGGLPAYGQPDVEIFKPDVKLLDSSGKPHSPFHQKDYCTFDPQHGWDAMHADCDNGKNDAFVKVNGTNGVNTLGYYDETDSSFYYEMANTYAISDHYFSAVLGPTGPNRLYLYAGTSSGHIKNGPTVAAGQPNIFKRLKAAGVSFGVYSGGGPSVACTGLSWYETGMFCGDIPGGAKSLAQFKADAAADKLPHVVWIFSGNDEHPIKNMQIGEKDVQTFYNALANSPAWKHAAFILTYDEDGGFYDHMPPPKACEPDDVQPNVPAEASTPGKFDRYGFRVPLIIASPYSKPHFVSHVVNSHTSILRFIELVFKVPALSNRDANAEPLLDFFDFSQPSFETPKIPANVTVASNASIGCP